MRVSQSAFILALFAILIFSCNSTSNRGGTVIGDQFLLDEVAGLVIDTVPAGSFISFGGELSRDSSWMNVNFDGKDGWLPAWSVAIDAIAGYLAGPTDALDNEENKFAVLPAGTKVAVGESIGDLSRIFYISDDWQPSQAWVQTSMIAYDPGAMPDVVPAVDYGESDIISIPVNLAGVPTDFLNKLQSEMRITPDTEQHRITVAVDFAEPEIKAVVNTLVKKKQEGGGDGDEYGWVPSPAWQYLSAYTAQVPSFVDIGPRSEYIQYADDEFKTDYQSLRAFLMMRIDRSPENIQFLYDTFGDFLKYALRDKDVAQEIQELIETHNFLATVPDYEEKCRAVLRSVKRWDLEHARNGIIEGGSILARQRALFAPVIDEKTAQGGEFETASLARYSFWLRRIDEGNHQVVYKILWDLVGDMNGMDEEPDTGPVETMTCTFQGYSLSGDCKHITFDCGDFGNADISPLTDEEWGLWKNLAPDGKTSNPEYVGKTFVMKVGTAQGLICNDGQNSEGSVAQILEFKLAN
jgi:hypothetical protein